MNKDTRFLIDLVKNANKLITDEFEVKAKGNDGDLVTNYDLEIENYMISTGLNKLFHENKIFNLDGMIKVINKWAIWYK